MPESPQPNLICRSGGQPGNGVLGLVCLRTANLSPCAVSRDLKGKALLALCVVAPFYGHGSGSSRLLGRRYWLSEEELAPREADGVDVVLYVQIAVGSHSAGIVGSGVGAVLGLPPVGHAVVVSIGSLGACPPLPLVWSSYGECSLVGDEIAFLSERHHLVYHVAVGLVAVGQ